MTLSRRTFMGHLSKTGAGLYLCSAAGFEMFAMFSCETTILAVVTDVEAWEPDAEKAVNAILLIAGSPGAAAAAAVVEGSLKQVLLDVQQYLSITPPPVGLLAKIQAGLQIVANNFQAFLNTIGATNPIVGTIVAIAQVLFSAIAGFITSIIKLAPVSLRAAASAVHPPTSFTVNGQSYPVKAKTITGSQLKSSVNSALDKAKAQGVNVPAAAYIQ